MTIQPNIGDPRLRAPDNEDVFMPQELPLDDEISSYLAALAQRAPGTIFFRTGAGRIFRDLLIHWPALEGWEDEAQELCQRITDAVYPLTGALFAQAIEITATISSSPIVQPKHVDAMSTYVIFDMENNIERQQFLSPHHVLPDADISDAPRGVAILCCPLHYRYHTIKDDRKRIGHPHGSFVEMTERLINEMLDQPDFVPREKRILMSVDAMLKALPEMVVHAAASRAANLARQNPRLPKRAPPVIATVTSLSALPPPVHALERRLMAYVTDKKLSPDLRLGLRRIAQSLRAQYPQAMIEEAARYETITPALKPSVSTAQPSPRVQPVAEAKPPPTSTLRPKAQAAMPAPMPPMPHFADMPLSIRPSVLLPSMPQGQQQAAPTRETRPVVQPQPAVTQQPASQPAPRAEPSTTQPEQPRAATPRESAPQPETRAASQPAETRQHATEPTQRPEPSRAQAEQPRSAATREPAQQPEARPASQPARTRQRTAEPAQGPEPSTIQTGQPRSTATREPAPQPKARPSSQLAAAQQRDGQSAPRAEPTRPRSARRSMSPTEEEQPTTRPAFPRESEVRPPPEANPTRWKFHEYEPDRTERSPMSAFHPFSDMEVRPTGFYKRLGMPMPKIFPKAAPFAGAGKFDKAALFKLGQHGMPAPKTFPHAIHLAGIRLFDKAALLNFVRHGIPMPKAFPKAAPAADAERIDKAARPKLGNAIKTPRTAIQKPRPWAFPTPSLTLTPQSPVVKTRK